MLCSYLPVTTLLGTELRSTMCKSYRSNHKLIVFQDNYTALHIAVESCKPGVVETLLGYGADVHVRGGKQKETALHIAARIPDGKNTFY